MKTKYNPFPRIAFNYKFANAVLKNIYEDVNYANIRDVVLGNSLADNEIESLANTAVACFYDMHNRRITSEDKISNQFKYFFNQKLNKNFSNFLSQNINDSKNLYFRIASILTEAYSIDKQHYLFALIIATELIYLENSIYFVFSSEFTQNCLGALSEKMNVELSYYLEAQISERIKESSDELNFEKIVEVFKINQNYLENSKLTEIRLFGSALNGKIHRESDIDLILQFEYDTTIEEKIKIQRQIAKFIKKSLYKRCDFQEMNDYFNEIETLIIMQKSI